MDKNPIYEEEFSLSEGGPFHNAMVKMRLHNKQSKLAIISLMISWVPLVIITCIEGTFYSGTQMPFLFDISMQARMLVALPMLVLIKVFIDSKVVAVAKYISKSLLSHDELETFSVTLLQRARKLTNSSITEIILLLIVIVTSISFVKSGFYSGLESGTSSWMVSSDSGNNLLSFAGYWAIIVSIPLFQFLFYRWLWRYFVWILLLFRLSQASLNLLTTHADRAGGLGILMLAQRSFNLIFVVGSVVLSGQFIAQVVKHPDSFNAIRSEAIGYIVISILLILIPLLFFIGKLSKIKNEGLLSLSLLGASLSYKFEREWLNNLTVEKRIENKEVDPSMLVDYAGMYDLLQQLRTVPVTLRDISGLALVLFVPFIPILFIHFSVGELLQKIAGLLT